MNYQDAKFFKELLSMFKMESDEHIDTITSGLNRLKESQTDADRSEILETVFRAAHSLKGAARTVGLVDIEPIGQSLENIFSTLKNKKVTISDELFDLLNQAVGKLSELVGTMDEQGKISGDKSDLTRLIDRMNEHMVLVST